MPVIVPPIAFIHRRRRSSQTPGPAALTLVAAAFGIDDGAFVTLTFGRAVSVAGFDPLSVSVEHQPLETVYLGSSGLLLDAATVKVELGADVSCDPGSEIVLTAGAGNGIVAADDGAAWAGVADLVLPFP